MARKYFVLILILSLLLPAGILFAQSADLPAKGFSIKPSQDWIELPLPLQGVVVSYGKKGTLATFHITERDLDEIKNVEQMRWEDLFSPQFGDIKIHTEEMTVLGAERARFCIYSLKPGEFKTTMEGKLPGKYINYVLTHGGKLFSITFKDAEDGFPLNYPSFLAAVRTLRFDAPAAESSRKTT